MLSVPPDACVSYSNFRNDVTRTCSLPVFASVVSHFVVLGASDCTCVDLRSFSTLYGLVRISTGTEIVSGSSTCIRTSRQSVGTCCSILSGLVVHVSSVKTISTATGLVPVLVGKLGASLGVSSVVSLTSVFKRVSTESAELRLLPNVPGETKREECCFPSTRGASGLLGSDFQIGKGSISPSGLNVGRAFRTLSRVSVPRGVLSC